jgi:hypothetical protein
MNQLLLNKLLEAEKYFAKGEYKAITGLSRELFERGQFDLCEIELGKLPTKEQLLRSLVEKLKEKSVYKTLRKIQEGQVDNDLITLKGLLSLGTHIVIECEHGNREYGILLPTLLEKSCEVAYSVLDQRE